MESQAVPGPLRMTETVPLPTGTSRVIPAAVAKAPPSMSEASSRISTCVPSGSRSKRRLLWMLPPKGRGIGNVEDREAVLDLRGCGDIRKLDGTRGGMRGRQPEIDIDPVGEAGVDFAGTGFAGGRQRREGGEERPQVERVEGERAGNHRLPFSEGEVQRPHARIVVQGHRGIVEFHAAGRRCDLARNRDRADRGARCDAGLQPFEHASE